MYMNFYNKATATQENASTVTGRKPTSGQLKYYTDLCKQRNLDPKDTSAMNFDQVSDMIKELQKFYPASASQIDLIKDKVSILAKMLSDMNFNDEQISMFEQDPNNLAHVITAQILRDTLHLQPIIESLTGGRTGTASSLIEKLILAENYFKDKQPVTESQVDQIISMFLCPDVDFETHGLSRRIDIDIEEGTWRKPTPEELTNQIQELFNRKSASDFINSSSNAFFEWKKTRIRPNQLNYIMELEKQLANDSKLREHRQAVDEEGNIITVGKSANVQVDGTAYLRHTDEQLVQLSVEQASDLINQLKSEVDRKEEFTLEDEIFETARNTDLDTKEKVLQKEFEILDSMMYTLEAMAGYNDEELHNCATYIVSSSPEEDGYKELYIRDFIRSMLEKEAITYIGVLELALESEALQRILLNM